jgi:hypothetical protein
MWAWAISDEVWPSAGAAGSAALSAPAPRTRKRSLNGPGHEARPDRDFGLDSDACRHRPDRAPHLPAAASFSVPEAPAEYAGTYDSSEWVKRHHLPCGSRSIWRVASMPFIFFIPCPSHRQPRVRASSMASCRSLRRYVEVVSRSRMGGPSHHLMVVHEKDPDAHDPGRPRAHTTEGCDEVTFVPSPRFARCRFRPGDAAALER